MEVEKEILYLCKEQFGTNLAAVAIFGSYNYGPYLEGVSDIDAIVLLHKRDNLALKDEKSILTAKGEKIKLSVQQLATVEEIKERIYREGSWSSWITLICGSKQIYTTNEFKSLIQELKNKDIPKDNLLQYILHKDEFELEGYLPKTTGWDLTKGLYSHLRRKLQIINYYTNKKSDFSYISCLMSIELKEEDKKRLNWLSEMYTSREILTPEAAKMYFEIAKELTIRSKTILNGL